jgi:hypothetical protein
MAEKSKTLPPVPAPIVVSVNPPTPGQSPRAPMPMPQAKAPARTIFDGAPASVAAARKKAEDTRRALASALQALRNAAAQVESAQEAASSDIDTASILAQEGLPPQALKDFADLAAPLLKAFTAA